MAPSQWKFDTADWWLEEHGLIMEKPTFPLPPGKYLVTGDRQVTTVLTIQPRDKDGNQRWELADGATLYDVTHLGCRSARYTPATGNNSCSPANVRTTGFPAERPAAAAFHHFRPAPRRRADAGRRAPARGRISRARRLQCHGDPVGYQALIGGMGDARRANRRPFQRAQLLPARHRHRVGRGPDRVPLRRHDRFSPLPPSSPSTPLLGGLTPEEFAELNSLAVVRTYQRARGSSRQAKALLRCFFASTLWKCAGSCDIRAENPRHVHGDLWLVWTLCDGEINPTTIDVGDDTNAI